MIRLLLSLQRLVLFVSVLACRCATTHGRSERESALSDRPEAITLYVASNYRDQRMIPILMAPAGFEEYHVRMGQAAYSE